MGPNRPWSTGPYCHRALWAPHRPWAGQAHCPERVLIGRPVAGLRIIINYILSDAAPEGWTKNNN